MKGPAPRALETRSKTWVKRALNPGDSGKETHSTRAPTVKVKLVVSPMRSCRYSEYWLAGNRAVRLAPSTSSLKNESSYVCGRPARSESMLEKRYRPYRLRAKRLSNL